MSHCADRNHSSREPLCEAKGRESRQRAACSGGTILELASERAVATGSIPTGGYLLKARLRLELLRFARADPAVGMPLLGEAAEGERDQLLLRESSTGRVSKSGRKAEEQRLDQSVTYYFDSDCLVVIC